MGLFRMRGMSDLEHQWYSLQQTPLVSQQIWEILKHFTTNPPCFATSDNNGGFVARNTTDCNLYDFPIKFAYGFQPKYIFSKKNKNNF